MSSDSFLPFLSIKSTGITRQFYKEIFKRRIDKERKNERKIYKERKKGKNRNQ